MAEAHIGAHTPSSREREMLLFDGDRGNVRLSSASALENL